MDKKYRIKFLELQTVTIENEDGNNDDEIIEDNIPTYSTAVAKGTSIDEVISNFYKNELEFEFNEPDEYLQNNKVIDVLDTYSRAIVSVEEII